MVTKIKGGRTKFEIENLIIEYIENWLCYVYIILAIIVCNAGCSGLITIAQLT